MWYIVILSILAVLVFVLGIRLFLLHRSIEQLTDDFADIIEDGEAQRNLLLLAPNKKLEHMAALMNRHISNSFIEKYEQKQKIKRIRNEITNITHDLRTPLTSIMGYVELMEQKGESQKDREMSLAVIKRRSQNLNELVQHLYEYARLENQDLVIKREPVDIYRLFKEHLLNYYTELEEKEIDTDIVIGDKLVMIMADPEALKRVFINLTSNAIKYCNGKLGVSLKTEAGMAVITYQNPRADIKEYEAERIFERYYRKQNTGSAYGSGLGLTITKLLVERMGGEITARAENGGLDIICCFALKL